MNKFKKSTMTACIILVVAILVGCIAGASFIKKRNFVSEIKAGPGVTSSFMLSEYNEKLAGTFGDTTVYVLEGKQPGGSFLILGGTHGNEPAGYMAAITMLENAVVEQGTLYIIPETNRSGLTHNDAQEGAPQYISFETPNGLRTFHYGSRATAVIDQWPDPSVYIHAQSGQSLSGSETRNINRAYPGRQDGNFTEQIAYAITQMIIDKDITMEMDLHEASPEYPVINATVAHENAMPIATEGILNIQLAGIKIALEPSPVNLHGLTHRELGDATDTYALLMEVGNPSQGRLRGATSAELVLTGKDPCYAKAQELGNILYIDYSAGQVTIEERVGRHIQGCIEYMAALSSQEPEHAIVVSGLPTYADLMKEGANLGDWLI